MQQLPLVPNFDQEPKVTIAWTHRIGPAMWLLSTMTHVSRWSQHKSFLSCSISTTILRHRKFRNRQSANFHFIKLEINGRYLRLESKPVFPFVSLINDDAERWMKVQAQRTHTIVGSTLNYLSAFISMWGELFWWATMFLHNFCLQNKPNSNGFANDRMVNQQTQFIAISMVGFSWRQHSLKCQLDHRKFTFIGDVTFTGCDQRRQQNHQQSQLQCHFYGIQSTPNTHSCDRQTIATKS